MSGYFESVQWNACVHRLDLGLYSHPKEFWGNGVRTHVNSKGKIPSTGKILLRGGWDPRRCIKQDSQPNTLPASYSPEEDGTQDPASSRTVSPTLYQPAIPQRRMGPRTLHQAGQPAQHTTSKLWRPKSPV